MSQKIRVTVFDDHPVIRDNIEMLVDAEDDMICTGMFPDCTDLEGTLCAWADRLMYA